MGNPYATLDELKAYLSIDQSRFDGLLTDALESVSDEIELQCDRQFNKDVGLSTREYPANTCFHALVDDFWTTSGLVIETGPGFSDVWAASDYRLYPLNGVAGGQTGWPYCKIRTADLGTQRFGTEGVRVTARWGWVEVPNAVHQACLIMAAATFQIKDSPFGVAGSDQWGTIRVRDNQMAANKINRYVRSKIRVG